MVWGHYKGQQMDNVAQMHRNKGGIFIEWVPREKANSTCMCGRLPRQGGYHQANTGQSLLVRGWEEKNKYKGALTEEMQDPTEPVVQPQFY